MRQVFSMIASLVMVAGCAPPPESPPSGPSSLAENAQQTAVQKATAGPPKRATESTVSRAEHARPAPVAGPGGYEASASELAAYERAKPVFERHCTACHRDGTRLTSGEAMRKVDMNGYPFGGAPRAAMTRTVMASLTGGGPTMPPFRRQPLTAEEVALIRAWAAATDAANR
jgi:mono/diheme cytochrome c family protein